MTFIQRIDIGRLYIIHNLCTHTDSSGTCDILVCALYWEYILQHLNVTNHAVKLGGEP